MLRPARTYHLVCFILSHALSLIIKLPDGIGSANTQFSANATRRNVVGQRPFAPAAIFPIIPPVQEPRRIQQLSPSLVNRIAAGEVIERPAAVVKELVENALDAGASSIIVEAEDGGRAAMRVIDDGAGIPPDELPLAFAAHATSKLSCDDDLFRIATLGFRGEALASIGSVSHARILSRTAGSEAAYELQDRGGELSDVQAAAGNIGTTVEIRNLFFNTPARRKFIKGSSTEFGHISEMVLRLALPHPKVAFRLFHNGRLALDLPAAEPEVRLLAAWPKEFHEQRLTVHAGDVEVRLRGLVGLPELSRPTARYQYLYLNGRHIRDRYIQHALREAYRGLTEPGRHPAAVLLLEMPAGDVDVNVHPTKSEVRFRDGGRVHGLVMSGVREKLLGSDLTPLAAPRPASDDAPQQELRQKLAAFFKQQLPAEAIDTMEPPAEPQLPLATPTAVRKCRRRRFPRTNWSRPPLPTAGERRVLAAIATLVCERECRGTRPGFEDGERSPHRAGAASTGHSAPQQLPGRAE